MKVLERPIEVVREVGKKRRRKVGRETTAVGVMNHRHRAHLQKFNLNPKQQLLLSRYLACLEDPFKSGPVRLGWGCYAPSALFSSFLRQTWGGLSTTTGNFAFVINPAAATQAYSGSTANDDYLAYYESVPASASATLISSATASGLAATNQLALATQIDTFRTIAAGARITIRHSANTGRGSLFAFFVPDATSAAITAKTYNGLQQLNAATWSVSANAGEISTMVSFRPEDVSAFIFQSGSTSNSAQRPHLVIGGIGWPANNFVIDIAVITHMESFSGVDASGQDPGGLDSLAGNGVTTDQAGLVAASLPTVYESADIITTVDQAVANISNSLARTGMGGPIPGIPTGAGRVSGRMFRETWGPSLQGDQLATPTGPYQMVARNGLR